ncbi:Cof-type HAD-IIB family hydrolase [Nonomuraea sp. NPDC050663]|uniref:Cof-type HAD-IIB family hydrolase n=1 Tax=Nonomuraea sp. NPDC050663 TaxID=3364370 RepID=UPI0037A76C8C
MTSVRIVATDLDGTLLDSTGAVSTRNRRALDRARAAGAEVVFVTARPPRGLDVIAAAAGADGLAICSNGAVVYDLARREVVATHALAAEVSRKLAQAIAEALPGVVFAVETGHGVLVEPGYGRCHLHDERFCTKVESVFDVDVPFAKLMAWSRELAADEMLAVAHAAAPGLAEITHSGVEGLLEISATGVTKAGSLAMLCQDRGVEPDEVVAFGDMPNDVPMLAFAGRGYAMANAHPLVLEAARFTTLSNDEDGVAAILEELFPNADMSEKVG